MATPVLIPSPPPSNPSDIASAPPSEVPPGLNTENPALETARNDPAADSAAATAAFSARLPRRKRDRWTPYKGARARSTVFTPELVTEILETIERFGFTDAEAAVHCHVSTSTLNRWKQEDLEFSDGWLVAHPNRRGKLRTRA